MARRPLGLGSYAHVYNRGVRSLPIFREPQDLQRLLLNFFYFNHREPMPDNWKRELPPDSNFSWPDSWGEREPITSILGFSIMPNHLHLIVKESTEGGISKFMHRTSMGYSKFINEKYEEDGSLFQGAYKSRLVENDADFRNLAVYVMVKNPFELYPGGLRQAIRNFDDAYDRAAQDPLNSLGAYAGIRELPIIDKDLLGELFDTPEDFKEFARETMLHRLSVLDDSEFE